MFPEAQGEAGHQVSAAGAHVTQVNHNSQQNEDPILDVAAMV